MLKIVAAILAALVVLVLAVVVVALVTRPDDFAVQRSTTINAPADKVHPLLNDFKQWASWSPYEKLDTSLTRNYMGAPQGVGAAYSWDGPKAGAGTMTITGSTPDAVNIRLEFTKPMTATNDTVFTLTPDGAGTIVTWRMSGRNSLMAKVFGLFVDMDKLIGADFERGLADLKKLAER